MSKRENQLRVLWIEDELLKEGAGLFETRLEEKHGFDDVHIAKAPHVKCAWEEVQSAEANPPDLIILDIMLPRTEQAAAAEPPRVDMNAGYLIWYGLRKLGKCGGRMVDTPIVVITARGNPEFRSAMEQDENLKWLGKPMSPEELADEVVAWLGKRGEEPPKA